MFLTTRKAVAVFYKTTTAFYSYRSVIALTRKTVFLFFNGNNIRQEKIRFLSRLQELFPFCA